jgi:hypothetical protein
MRSTSAAATALAALLLGWFGLAAEQSAQIVQAIKSGQIDPHEFDANFVRFECGNSKSTIPPDLIATHRQLQQQQQSSHGSPAQVRKRRKKKKNNMARAEEAAGAGAEAAAANATVVVPTYFHLVTTAAKANSIPTAMWQQQLGALNRAYGASGFQFRLVGTTRTANDSWATGSDPRPMQAALRRGGYATLNLYFLSDLANNILGQCSMPTRTATATAADYVMDGCLIHAATMPAGGINGYDLGLTAVHETGHWMGLLHTFEGYSCTGDGDFVADTPAESTPTNGCPVNKDSCPDVEGLDPVHNYMDYSTDACYTSFTDGQIARMRDIWNIYRQGK